MSVSSSKINDPYDDGKVVVREVTPFESAQKKTAKKDLKKEKSEESFKQDKTNDGVKIESPKNSVNNGVKIGAGKNDIKKDITKPSMQPLLSDWRTAMSNQPKVKQPGSQNVEANQGYERIKNQGTVYPGHDVREKKPVCNKSRINQELKFVSDEVKSIHFSFIFYQIFL